MIEKTEYEDEAILYQNRDLICKIKQIYIDYQYKWKTNLR